MVAAAAVLPGCRGAHSPHQRESPAPSEATKRGSIEVVAELMKIPEGAIFERDLYNYATVLKYEVSEVRRGDLSSNVIYVAHYNPFKPRGDVADRKAPDVGGSLETFESGQVHHLALEAPIDNYYMGGIVNKYFGEDIDTIYWGVWTSEVDD